MDKLLDQIAKMEIQNRRLMDQNMSLESSLREAMGDLTKIKKEMVILKATSFKDKNVR